ncbi:MAG: hypothetical protein A3K65_03815 [Euryarchaeota archaeon RBG_16_68_12]|nr:MAG: hypothetical protein A3K65_03815 [Euryarchaeota archaeon RBG_16_68_12]
MRLIQARVPDAEYELLKSRARKVGKPMQEIVREALRAHLLPDRVDPNDPIFQAFPVFRSRGGRKARTSERHDEVLYGEAP